MAQETFLPYQEPLTLESESDEARSDLSSDDSDDERLHFELRLDPIEDISEDNVDSIPPEPSRKRARRHAKEHPLSWKTESDTDATPPPLRFLPAREPGVQLRAEDNHTPLDLFKLFFPEDVVETLCHYTNKQAFRNMARGATYTWEDVGVAEFYRFLGLVFFTGIVKMGHISDYWRRNNIFSVPFPAEVMTRDRYRTIFWNVHMSDPDEDRVNDAKKGTPAHDKLLRLKPLMNTIRNTCKTFYHPRRNLSVDEPMVTSRGNTRRQYTKDNPTKQGFKLFVLADSSNGYTVDFSIYAGKEENFPTGQGLSYDSVMSLIDRGHLGSGYHVYMNEYYTSPKLFKDLYASKFGACGRYRESRRDCPRSDVNALTKSSPRGTIRWIRDGPLVYVKWRDAQEVSVCSTIHAAYAGDTVQQRVKTKKDARSKQSVPCPKPMVEFNKFMGGPSILGSTAHLKTVKWYKTLFLHFLDIAATNAFILHRELMQNMQKESMRHGAFMEELVAQLCGVLPTPKAPVKTVGKTHKPVCGIELSTDGKRVGDGRKLCVYCRQQGRNIKTQWMCKACNVYLCLQPDRNCYDAWHPDED